LTPAQVFAQTILGKKFKTFGLSTTLNKMQDFRKITQLLQTMAGSPDLSAAFQAEYSFTKMLKEIVESLDIDTEKIKASAEEKQQAQFRQQIQNEAMKNQATGQVPQGGGQADIQSQIGQMMNTQPERGVVDPRGMINQGMTGGRQ
jgi:hypothetical protein